MRHHPTFDGALMAQNSQRHHHRAPIPWGGGAAHRHYPHWRWRTDGAMTHRWQPNPPASRHMRERAATKNMSLKRIQKLSRVNEVRIAYLFISDFKRGEGLDRSD
jgi:hypothetical protein